MTRRYAEGTAVGSEQSRMEIEKNLRRYGATGFMYGWDEDDHSATVCFKARDRHVRFVLPLPDPDEKQFWQTNHATPRRRTASGAREAYDQECRRRWRALALVIKAKLEAVETGIVSFEHEFLAHIVMPDGLTVGQHVQPRIAQAYNSGHMPPMLPNYGGES